MEAGVAAWNSGKKAFTNGFMLSDKPRIIVTDREEEIEVFKRGCEIVAVMDKNVGREDIPEPASIVERFCGFE